MNENKKKQKRKKRAFGRCTNIKILKFQFRLLNTNLIKKANRERERESEARRKLKNNERTNNID